MKTFYAEKRGKRSRFRHIYWLLLLLLQNSMAQVSPTVPATTSQHNKQVIGYITQWDAWKNSSGLVPLGGFNQLNVDYSQYTILNFAFFGVANDGSLHSGDYRNKNIYQVGAVQAPAPLLDSDIYSSWDLYLLNGDAQSGAPGLITLAHQKGVKAMASIGGWSMCKHYPAVAADPVKRAKFIDGCKKLISMGFDGIDIDWEYPGYQGMNIEDYSTADYTNFAVLVEAIRTAIGSSKLITACFSAVSAKLAGFDWTRLNNTLDYYNLMTYDFNGGWSNIAGHNSPLYDYPGEEFNGFSIDAAVKGVRALGVNMSKVNIGVAFYGRGVVTNGTAALNAATVKQSVTVQPDGPIQTSADLTNWTGDWNGMPYYNYILQTTGSGSGWTAHWDSAAHVPYMTKGNYFLSYDNERSVGEKAQYAVNNKLAGVIVWEVFGDMTNMTSSTVAKGKGFYCPNTKSPLVNKINEVFAAGTTNPPTIDSAGKVITGYWQNWGNTSQTPPYIPLRNINSKYNVVEVAFALNGTDNATMSFAPANGTQANFISDMQYLQAQGKKVLISVGGATGTVTLNTAAQKQAFISSMESILDTYNFDGFDLDLEGSTTLQMDNGDNNFMSPTTAKVVNMIDAVKQIISYRQAKGKTCWLTMAPETYYVQTAYNSSYSPLVGAYLPLIYGLRSQLTFIHTQYYNTGTVKGLDNGIYAESTPDFIVSMTEMLLKGFPVAGTSLSFPALRPDQVAFGLPAVPAAAGGGYLAPAGVKQALNYLMKAQSFGGSYKLQNTAGYPGLRGIMTWSINWDTTNGNEFANNYYDYFFGTSTNTNTPPVVSITSPAANATFKAPASVTITASATDAKGSVTKVGFYNGTTLLAEVTASPYTYTWGNVAAGTYTLTAVATDNNGATTTSSGVTIVVNSTTPPTTDSNICSGIANWDATKAYVAGSKVVYNYKLYNAKWYTLNNQPDINTGSGKPWDYLGACPGSTNQALTVSITTPVNAQRFTARAKVTITATAATTSGSIAKVDFFNGGTLLGTATASPYSYTWNGVAAGTYSLTAIATDNKGATNSSSVVTVVVVDSAGNNSCTSIADWDATVAYVATEEAVYNNKLYRAKWYTLNNQPDINTGSGKPWELLSNCATGSTRAEIIAALIDNSTAKQTFTAYPNPVTGDQLYIQVDAHAGDHLQASLLSMEGNSPLLMQQFSAAGNGVQLAPIDVSRVRPGIWILKVKNLTTGRVETKKLIRLTR